MTTQPAIQERGTAMAIRDIKTAAEFSQLIPSDIHDAGVNDLRSMLSTVFDLPLRVDGKVKNKAQCVAQALEALAEMSNAVGEIEHPESVALAVNPAAEPDLVAEVIEEMEAEPERAALDRISAIASNYAAGKQDAAVLAAQGGAVSLTESCYLVQVSLETGYGAKKMPAELMRDAGFAELLKENGVKDRSSIAVFEALDIPVTLIKQYIPEWEPKRTGEVYHTISTSWATNILRTRFEVLRKKLFKPVSKELGWMFPANRMNEVAEMLEDINQLCAKLVELLTCDEVFEAAKDLYECRVAAVVRAAVEKNPENELSAEVHINDLLAEFPLPHDLRNAFKVTITPPRKLPSLAERIEGDAAASKSLASSLDSKNQAALAAMQSQGLDSLRASVEEQASELQNELMTAVADAAKRITLAKGECSSKMAEKLTEIKERIGVIADMLAGLTGQTPYADLAERMQLISSAYTLESERDTAFMQLAEVKAAIKSGLDSANPDDGVKMPSTGHMALTDWMSI